METLDKVEVGKVVELKPVTVNAVQSIVEMETSIKETDYVTLGHIGMYDFEDVPLARVKHIIRHKIGCGFIFNSHGDNYHVWSPEIKSMQEIREIKDRIVKDDSDHNKIGVQKGAWALRISNKGDKPEPQFIEYCKATDYNIKTKTVSKPHMQILMQLTDSTMANNIFHECKTVGDETRVVEYPTYQNNHQADDLADADEVIGD